LFVRGREACVEPVSAERRSAGIQEHDIFRHQVKQASKIAGIDCINPIRVQLTNGSLI